MEISKYIKEILFVKDNVIIPDFGAFERINVSASIDDTTGEMTPPHMNINFRPEIKSDGGVLIKYIAEKENIGEDKAAEEIKKQVELWQDNLKAGKNVILPGIGLINEDASGKMVFQTHVNPADFPDSFGLPVIKVAEKAAGGIQTETTTPIEKKKEKKAVPPKKKPIKKPVKHKTSIDTPGDKKSNKKLIVGLIIGVPVAAMIVLGALNFEFVKEKFNSTTEFVSHLIAGDKQKDTTGTIINVDTLTAEDSSNIETETILENYNVVNAETNTKIEPKMEQLSSMKKVHIIAGSFKAKKSAQSFRNKLNKKGLKAEVLPEYNGLFRVSIGSYDKVETAVNDFERIKSIDESLSIWVLVAK